MNPLQSSFPQAHQPGIDAFAWTLPHFRREAALAGLLYA
jgi:hypothetical protein